MRPDLTRASQVRFIQLLAWLAGILLLVCCVNLSGLLIARNSARTREFAIRASLGAGRTRLVRQMITESFLLAVSGGLVGMLFSLALTAALNAMFYSMDVEGHPLYYNFNPEPRVLIVVIAMAIVAGCLTGIIPALRSIGVDAAEKLKQKSSAVSANSRSGRWLAGSQAGVAVALTSVAGLLTMGARSIVAGNGLETSHVALMRLRPRLINYPPEKAQRYLWTVIARFQALPGVESASMVGNGAVTLGGDAPVSLPDNQPIESGYIEIGPRYFETLRTPILRGREFNERDTTQSPPVAIVNEALARRHWFHGDG